VFDLKRRTGDFEEYAKWEGEEFVLRSILLQATRQMGWLSPEERMKYEASATEQEVYRGALGSPDAHEHVFCFFRTIKDLPRDESARAFVDFDPIAKARDEEAAEQLQALKDALRRHLPGHVYDYEAEWDGNGPTLSHLDRLCEDVVEALSGVIGQQVQELGEVDKVEKERKAHEAFGGERAQDFFGRQEVFERIRDYLGSGERSPLAIVGVSGSGKSALMAEAERRARTEFPNAEVITRFIGATPESSDGRQLLIGLSSQISRAYEPAESPVPTDWKELVEEFPKRLALATSDRPLILFLDALDQLSDAERARSLTWLPGELPENVRLVVSTLEPDATEGSPDPGAGEPLRAIRARLSESARVALGPLDPAEGERVLDAWLKGAGRTLQARQRKEVLTKFAANGLPLYLKLAFEEARRWKSYPPDDEPVLAADIDGVIRTNLFKRLSHKESHGPVVVSRGLGYLAAARFGLSEDELMDVLSADEKVLRDFEAFHKLSEPRLPVVVWSRLFSDLEPYLTERIAEGGALMGFYHRQLAKVVAEDYLAGEDGLARHRDLAEYFKGEGYTNVRTLAELPYQQTMAQSWDDVFETLTSFDFLERKAADIGVVTTTDAEGKESKTYTGIYQIREDYELALDNMPGNGGRGGRGGRRRIIVTATDFHKGKGYEIRCPHCNTLHPLAGFEENPLGEEIDCPNPVCNGPLRVNSFTAPPQ
jgi:hypothetical protein